MESLSDPQNGTLVLCTFCNRVNILEWSTILEVPANTIHYDKRARTAELRSKIADCVGRLKLFVCS